MWLNYDSLLGLSAVAIEPVPGEQCVYGGREKSGGTLEMVENGIEGSFK